MARRKCFVIMPFEGKFPRYYRDIYTPAVQAAGLDVRKADSRAGPEVLLNSICRDIVKADVVLAELSGKRLNVSYEIGYAHGRGKPVILLAQSMSAVPSDIRHIRVVLYREKKRAWRSELREQITRAIQAVMRNPSRYGPPAIEARKRRIAPKIRSYSAQRDAVIRSVHAEAREAMPAASGQAAGVRGMLRIRRANPSQIKQLQALLREHRRVELQWKGAGEEYDVWWEAEGAPPAEKVAEWAEMLGMQVGAEGYFA